MSGAGGVPIQGCALRITRLNADGSISPGATTMIVDDKPFMKFTAKPAEEAGVEMNPKSACGALLISYKDYDRAKRWDVTLEIGDLDFDKMEMLGGGSLLTAASSPGRVLSDVATTNGQTHITSATGFYVYDVGRTATGSGIPGGAFIAAYVNANEVVLSAPATATATGVSVTLGTVATRSIGYASPALLSVANPNGVALEIWQKIMVRNTGYQGTTPYPSAGSSVAPLLPPSAWARWAWPRCILKQQDVGVEDKESTLMYAGWAIENPLFGTGPVFDWTQIGLSGITGVTGVTSAVPLDTTKVFQVMMDFELPDPLRPSYQTAPSAP